MTFINSIKRFIMSVVKYAQEAQMQRALRHTHSYRLERFLESKGCKDTHCVEHWIKEFERKDASYGNM